MNSTGRSKASVLGGDDLPRLYRDVTTSSPRRQKQRRNRWEEEEE